MLEKSVQNISGHPVRRLENRRGESKSNLLLGLGGRSTSIHSFLVLYNERIHVLVWVLQRNLRNWFM